MASYETVPMAPRAVTNVELAEALRVLGETSAQASKAAEAYLLARDEWLHQRSMLDDAQAAVSKLREVHDPTGGEAKRDINWTFTGTEG